jgi:hypothetical protein
VSGTIRLPNGKTMTLNRARALGYADAAGNLTAKAPTSGSAARAVERDRRAAQWRKTQRLDEVEDLTPDGLPKRKKKIKPLVPKNVDKEDNPIEDPELLDQIAARTQEIEEAAAEGADES